MELDLDLDLSLSPHTNKFSKLGFDFDPKKRCVVTIDRARFCLDTTKKLQFDVIFTEECSIPKQNLTYLSDQRDEEEEDEDSLELDSSIVYDEKEIREIVGWPPVKSCMTKYHKYYHHHHHHQYHPYHHDCRSITNKKSNHTKMIERVGSTSSLSSSTSTTSKPSMYVKVKMEGVAITRKVDMKLFSSYKSLTNSLITMFTQCCDENKTKYKFSYQCKEGAYLLLQEDIPWKKFIECVHRIKIEKVGPFIYTKCLFER